MNLADLLRDAAGRLPEKPALIAGHSALITFRRMNEEADRVARGLRRMGVGRGDRVALGMHNIPEFAYSYFGILRAGAVAVPLNVMLTEPEVRRILEDSEARLAIVAPPFEETVRAATHGTSSIERIISTSAWSELGELGIRAETEDLGEDELAVLAYTSGTTAEPKGAMLTHGNLLANLHQQMAIGESEISEQDVLFLALPLFHIFGLNVTLGLVALNGVTGVLIEHFDAVATLRAIQDHKVTVIFGAPTMYIAWLDVDESEQFDLSSVRFAVSGAAPLAADVLERFRSRFGIEIFEGYGLTETAPTVTSSRLGSAPRAGSVGKPLPGVEIRLVDEDGNEVEPGDLGEVEVRGPNVFKGYWRRDEESRMAFHEGWLRTGDVGAMDEEGYLYLVDRKRDLIIVSGFNVFPSEVERALLENPKVQEAAVVGEPHPYTGETVKAYVLLRDGVSADETELMNEVSTRLARFKCPRTIEIVDNLPHLLTGKVLRRALRT